MPDIRVFRLFLRELIYERNVNPDHTNELSSFGNVRQILFLLGHFTFPFFLSFSFFPPSPIFTLLYHLIHAVWCALRSTHADWVVIGAD